MTENVNVYKYACVWVCECCRSLKHNHTYEHSCLNKIEFVRTYSYGGTVCVCEGNMNINTK